MTVSTRAARDPSNPRVEHVFPPEVIWRLRSVADNEWHFAQTALDRGTYQLLVTLSGNDVRGGIDDVMVVPGNCSQHSKASLLTGSSHWNECGQAAMFWHFSASLRGWSKGLSRTST